MRLSTWFGLLICLILATPSACTPQEDSTSSESAGVRPSQEGTLAPSTDPLQPSGTDAAAVPSMPEGPYVPENRPDNLEEFFTRILVLSSTFDAERFELGRSIVPTPERFAKGVLAEIPPEVRVNAQRRLSVMRGHEMTLSQTFTPRGSGVAAVGATPKMLADYDVPRVRAAFPKGVQQVAHLLQPGQTYYNVIVGDRIYHLVFWDGAQWSMLGRLWRDLQEAQPSADMLDAKVPPTGNDVTERANRARDCGEVVDHLITLMRVERPDFLQGEEEVIRARMVESCTDEGTPKEALDCMRNAKSMDDMRACGPTQ